MDPSVSALPQLPTITKSSVEQLPQMQSLVLVCEQLLNDYQVIDLSDDPSTTEAGSNSADKSLVNTALLAGIEVLEAECSRLQKSKRKRQHFEIDAVISVDHLVSSFFLCYIFSIFLDQLLTSCSIGAANQMPKK